MAGVVTKVFGFQLEKFGEWAAIRETEPDNDRHKVD